MKKKTNRTIWFWMCAFLFGLCEWTELVSTPANSQRALLEYGQQQLTKQSDADIMAPVPAVINFPTKQASAIKALAQVRATPSFLVENNLSRWAKLAEEMSDEAIKVIEGLPVTVERREVKHGQARLIPINEDNLYRSTVRLPRGTIPEFMASCAGTRIKAMLLKMALYALGTGLLKAELHVDSPYTAVHRETTFTSLLFENPDVPSTLIDIAEGEIRRALKRCKIKFELPFTLNISLPDTTTRDAIAAAA